MKINTYIPLKTAILGLALALMAAPILAEKPDHAGKGSAKNADRYEDVDRGQGNKQGKGNDQSREGDRDQSPAGAYFQTEKRVVVRDYFENQFRSGHCPPGLAKKNNGCQPPGQAKKWRKGYPLPRDVIYYDLPEPLIIQLGQPPASHRYVRVDLDILLITIGAGLVVDAIENMGGL